MRVQATITVGCTTDADGPEHAPLPAALCSRGDGNLAHRRGLCQTCWQPPRLPPLALAELPQVRAAARAAGVSVSEWVRRAIRAALPR